MVKPSSLSVLSSSISFRDLHYLVSREFPFQPSATCFTKKTSLDSLQWSPIFKLRIAVFTETNN